MASSSSGPTDLVQLMRNRMAELNDRTLVVSHLPRALQLKALIRAFKTSVNARFPTKKFRGNRKYAFLEFPSTSHAKQALQESTKFEFLGRAPMCELVSQKVLNGYFTDPQTYQLGDFLLNRLNISCLPRDTTVDDVRRLFPVATNVEFPTAGPGKAQGCARVDFAAEKDALVAFKTRHGVLLHNAPIIVNYCVRKKAGKRNKKERTGSDDKKGEIVGTSPLSASEIKRRKRLHSNHGGNDDNKKGGKIRRIHTGAVDRTTRNPGNKSVKTN
ncbi:nucleolin [Taenia solium]|eukprot:TsM_000451100 transcript=TsM_000451100 gene=TsM_000451100